MRLFYIKIFISFWSIDNSCLVPTAKRVPINIYTHIQQIRGVDTTLANCWANVVDGGPTLNQHWVSIVERLDERTDNRTDERAAWQLIPLNLNIIIKKLPIAQSAMILKNIIPVTLLGTGYIIRSYGTFSTVTYVDDMTVLCNQSPYNVPSYMIRRRIM